MNPYVYDIDRELPVDSVAGDAAFAQHGGIGKSMRGGRLSSWQPWQAAEIGGVVGVNPPGVAIEATAPTLST